MLKYRTLLTDPKGTGDRPKQALHPDTTSARKWAEEAIKGSSPAAYVQLFLTVEVEVHVFKQAEPVK
jgi:hypothetical protein